jgi:DNA-binding response OmpR family regulator
VERQSVRVLIVDDDEATRLVVRSGLDATVLEAHDGPEALGVLAQEHVDLVVLDVMLPHMSGYDILKRIREHATIAEVPVVMLSARRSEESHHLAYAAGADAYMTKPFDPMELQALIEKVLATSPEDRAAARAEQKRLAELLDQIEASFGS